MLARIRNAKEEGESGFTLIELLVVMIIIGILAAIAIPVFLNQRNSGYDAGAKSDVRNAATAEETYYTDNQAYLAGTYDKTSAPTGLGGLPGWKASGHTTSVVIAFVPSSATAATATGYLITGTSQSTKKFCYDSTNSNLGVYSCP